VCAGVHWRFSPCRDMRARLPRVSLARFCNQLLINQDFIAWHDCKGWSSYSLQRRQIPRTSESSTVAGNNGCLIATPSFLQPVDC
jgi:hypothetical protein